MLEGVNFRYFSCKVRSRHKGGKRGHDKKNKMPPRSRLTNKPDERIKKRGRGFSIFRNKQQP